MCLPFLPLAFFSIASSSLLARISCASFNSHSSLVVACVVLVSIIRTYPILSVVVADKILFAQENADAMYRAANELNIESVVGWHSIMLSDSSSIYMYRECAWINEQLDRDYLMEILLNCISEYKLGRAHLSAAIQKEQQ